MKKTTRLLALFLVVVLSLTTFVACKKDAEDKEKEELDPKKAIVGVWTLEKDISKELTDSTIAYIGENNNELVDLFEQHMSFEDINVVIEFDFDEDEITIEMLPTEEASDNLTEQFNDAMCDVLEAYYDQLGVDQQEVLAQLGYSSIREYVEDYTASQLNAESLLEEACEQVKQTSSYEIKDDKIYLGGDESSWMQFEFNGSDEFEATFDAEHELDETTELGFKILTGTYTKD